ncbi:MAG: nitroreductase family protein, partial [Ilumatobacteraceae bacterium]
MEPDDLLRATGASRTFTERRVSDAEIHAILDDARFAPSGGNRQPWRVVSLRDPSIRSTVVDATRSVWDDYVAITEDGRVPFNV